MSQIQSMSKAAIADDVLLWRLGRLRILVYEGNKGSPDDKWGIVNTGRLAEGDRPSSPVYGALHQASSTIGLYGNIDTEGYITVHALSGAEPLAVQPIFGQIAFIAAG